VVGLLATGAYMTQTLGRWSAPWILASLAGLALIVLLGAGVEGGRGRALARELRGSGSDLSAKAQRLLRDPLAWSARLMTLALMIAVVFDMTTKPASVGAAASLPAALAVGALCAVPLWRSEPRRPEPVSLLSRADR
jgi:hypothetical protein